MFSLLDSSVLPVRRPKLFWLPAFSSNAINPSKQTGIRKDSAHQTILFTSASVDIAYNRLHQYLYCHWKGSQSTQSLSTGAAQLLRLLEGLGCSAVLHDLRQTNDLHKVASWLIQHAATALTHAGRIKVSWILSANPFVQLITLLLLPQLKPNN